MKHALILSAMIFVRQPDRAVLRQKGTGGTRVMKILNTGVNFHRTMCTAVTKEQIAAFKRVMHENNGPVQTCCARPVLK